MTVGIVTDSVSDIPQAVAAELGITVVPLNVVFDDVTYRDGVDITTDEFYENLAKKRAGSLHGLELLRGVDEEVEADSRLY